MSNPTVVFLTGIPGAGKSTAGGKLREQATQAGLRLEFINDYPLMQEWANEHADDANKVSWFTQDDGSKNFRINLAAYRELSLWIAQKIGKITKELIAEGRCDVVVIESARGAGIDGQRDRYDEELFAPIHEVLGDLVDYANIEMVADVEVVMERMRERSLIDPEAAPDFVARNYVSETEGIKSSFGAALDRGDFAINQVVQNVTREQTELLLIGVIAQVMALHGREGYFDPEGKLHNGPEEGANGDTHGRRR